MDALGPAMIKILIFGISTLLEPSTTASATAAFAGFFDNATLGAVGAHFRGKMRCLEWFYRNTSMRITEKTLDHPVITTYKYSSMVIVLFIIAMKRIPFNTRYHHKLFHEQYQPLHNLPLQVWMPSAQVCPNFVSPASPHFWNQVPPRAQQLRTQELFIVPHLGQTNLAIFDVDMICGDFAVRGRTDFGHG